MSHPSQNFQPYSITYQSEVKKPLRFQDLNLAKYNYQLGNNSSLYKKHHCLLLYLLPTHGNYYCRDFQGNTALHLASLSRKISSAQTLLRMGANPLILNRYGYSPLTIRSTYVFLLKVQRVIRERSSNDNNSYLPFSNISVFSGC